MDIAYWVFEFLKVLAGYLLLGYAWPRTVFAKHLNGKSAVYQFSFCTTVQTVLVNTVVLGLGLLHILNAWTVRIVFYGVLLAVLYRRLGLSLDRADQLLQALPVVRLKLQFRRLRRWVWDWSRRTARALRAHWLEYLLLGALSVYALLYFSWSAFQAHSYGFGDQYVHHSWIYGLMEGKVFSGDVYPEAMHCMLYAIHTLLGVRAYSLMLFFGSIQAVVFLIAAYCFLREIFVSRYTPLFVLALFVLLSTEGFISMLGMARLQYTVPMEFGLAPQFLCAAHLIRYLREDREPYGKGKLANYILSPDLFLFAMALAAMTATHFYPVIMAFFMCLAVALLYLRRVFSKKRFLPLLASVLCGLLIAVAPMAGALAQGIPFQASMDWAVSVIEGTATEQHGSSQEMEELQQWLKDSTVPLSEKIGPALRYVSRFLKGEFELLSGDGEGGRLIYLFIAVLIACPLAGLTMALLRKLAAGRLKGKGSGLRVPGGYYLLLLMSLFFFAVYVVPNFGLPELLNGYRIYTTVRILLLGAAVIPLDLILVALNRELQQGGVQGVAAACFAVICVWSCSDEYYHGYLRYELSRYPAEVAAMNQIIGGYDKNTYTVVSPTDGLYHVIEYGRHEELLDFVRGTEEERYFLPTEHVFIFVEKKPLDYAQTHFSIGPRWLGMERDAGKWGSLNQEILSTEVSREAAEQETPSQVPDFENYRDSESRTILESKAYYWCQRFMELYPREMSVYYEDDSFVVYHFQQEVNSPYDLAIDYEEK